MRVFTVHPSTPTQPTKKLNNQPTTNKTQAQQKQDITSPWHDSYEDQDLGCAVA